ncbi:phage repressor protein [Tardiphaga sp.]|jgi:hypothetical protein|uniref:phage repressor protein n=1 Tax=Tardiphaga sp. TaxID=1926292 RepID=UPI0037DA531E
MDSLQKIVARIEHRLAEVGSNPSKASKDAGLSASAIFNLQRGADGRIKTKGVNAATLAQLAPVLKTTMVWLAEGIGPEEPDLDLRSEDVAASLDKPNSTRTVRIKGYVGAGSEAHFYKLADESFEVVEPPAGSSDQTIAVQIKGKSWGPRMDGWLVFYDDVRSPVTEDLYGQPCVVGLADDRILLKTIKRERDGSFTLQSNSDEPDIKNAEVEWAAKVIGMRPR